MEAGTRESSQQPTTAEEEALKRNTDCVYFLASPLTCKKGSECEYRHSEYARLNPRDCWFWLNANCLNPKCTFRHPPLDGLLGSKMATSTGPSQTASSAQIPISHNSSGKQPVPCIFFQKGLCLKGDKCSFIHGPQTVGNSIAQPSVPKVVTSVSEPRVLQNAFGNLEKCGQLQNTAQVNMLKPFEAQYMEAPAATSETTQPRNGVAVHKNFQQPIVLDKELPGYKLTDVIPVNSGSSISRFQGDLQGHVLDDRNDHNGRDADEFLGESSPGFDVLVDDELRESDYYHNEDEFERTRKHEGRHLNSLNEFDYGSADSRGYESYGRAQDQFAWEQHRSSSERILEGHSVPERRGFGRADNANRIDKSDLRHRLSKQRRLDGSASSGIPDHNGGMDRRDDRKRDVEELRYHPWRDSRRFPSHDGTGSSRLQGRISLPRRSSPENRNDMRFDRELGRGRNLGRRSPGRQPISSHHGRFQDRIKRRIEEDHNNEGRDFRGLGSRREDMDKNTLDFAGPKSLAELKGNKASDGSEEQQTRGRQSFSHVKLDNRMTEKFEGHQEYEDSVTFEGPKPLSVILKRKREAKTVVSDSGTVSSDGDESNRRESGEIVEGSSWSKAQTVLPRDSEKEASHHSVGGNEEASYMPAIVRTTEDEIISTRVVTQEGQNYHAQKEYEVDKEDGVIDEMIEDQEFENYVDPRDGEADDEQVDGGDSRIDDDAAEDPEEFLDDEDGDDFAKRIGVMFS